MIVALNDPNGNSIYPPCVFRATTGLWCPACGLTRGLHQLFNGNLGAALQHNVFLPLFVAALGFGWWSWVRVSWDRPPLTMPSWLSRPALWLVPVVLVAYGVLRNIPVAPFDALAP